MNDRFERMMGTLAFAAFVIAVTFAHREFSGRGVVELSRGSAAPLRSSSTKHLKPQSSDNRRHLRRQSR